MKRFLKWVALACGAAGMALGIYLVAIQLTGNFAAVVPGEVYRSNQPTPGEIAAYAARYRIRTIVNLRGRNERAAWYRNEVAAARSLGLTLIDFPMQADQRLDPKAADELAALLRDAPRPILIHCRSGADRTGLASVIYLARIARVDEETNASSPSAKATSASPSSPRPTPWMKAGRSWKERRAQPDRACV